jgi:hypothetical protein
MADTPGGNSVLEGLYHRLLADKLIECLGAILSIEGKGHGLLLVSGCVLGMVNAWNA